MATSKAKSVTEYLASLPPERRAALAAVRRVIKKSLPRGYEEGMLYGMMGYYVPLARYPETYNGQPLSIACLASQKNYMTLYLMGIYGDPDGRKWFEGAFKKAGKKLDMGQSCVRFRKLEDLPLDVIGEAIARTPVDAYIAGYEKAMAKRKRR
jgi:hypothetical protein